MMALSRRLLAAAAVVALLSTAGNLSFSLGMGLVPRDRCWYQRVIMYPLVVVPLVVVLGVAAGRGASASPGPRCRCRCSVPASPRTTPPCN